jgi:hypothetical protein
MLAALREDSPGVESTLGVLHGAELVPKPRYYRIPISITGSSRRDLDWIAANAENPSRLPTRTVALIDLLERLRDIGVNHVVLNLKYGRRPAAEMLDDLAQTIALLFLVHRLDAG